MAGKQCEQREVAFVPRTEVGYRVRIGVFWSAGQIVLRNIIAMGTTAILARILSPEDYGLTGMVMTLTAVLQIFSDMGLSWATVQRRGLTQAQVNNLFWLNVLVGGLLWGFCILIAPVISDFYGHSELVAVTIVMGGSFLISGFAVQPIALLRRVMDQRAITQIEISAAAVGAATAVACAFAGAGYWALVVQGLVTAGLRMVLALTRSGWQFKRPVAGVGTCSLVGFGGLLALNGLLIYFSRNLDSILIGRVWGAEALGVYNRAYFLMLLPSMLAGGILTGLMVPSLSALAGDRASFAETYRRALRTVAWFGTPMAVGLGLTAGPAVRLLYGPNWDEVVTILGWLSLAGVTQPIYNTNGWLFTASGRARAYLVLTLINSILLSGVFLWTVGNGIVPLARGYGIAMGIMIPLPALWFAHRAAGIPFLPSLQVLFPIAALNLLMGLSIWILGRLMREYGVPDVGVFTAQVVAGVSLYLSLTPVFAREMVRKDFASLLKRTRNV